MRSLLLALVVVLVNLPAAHQEWTDRRVATQGREVRASVVEARSEEGRNLVDYRLPASVDPSERVFSVAVDAATYDRLRATSDLPVRVVPGDPGAHRVHGEVRSRLFLVAAVGADLILLVVVLLLLHRRRRRRANGPDLYDLA